MLPRRGTLLGVALIAAACSQPAENTSSNTGGVGNSTAVGGTAGTGTIGGTSGGGTPSGGAAGTASSSGGSAGASSGGGAGAVGGGLSGAAGVNGSGSGGGSGGDGAAGISSGGDAGAMTGGAGGMTSGAAGATGGVSVGGAGSGGQGNSGGAAGTGGSTFGVCNGAPPARAVSVYVVGDSTASVYATNLYPRMGWGQPLQDLFATQCAVIHDVALSGRSSKSFIDEGAWTPVKNALASGDIVLIQFGHNDEKADDPTRYTEPQTTFKQYLTTYITETRAKQATPVLLTPVNRNSWSGTMVSNTHGTYPAAMRELATSLGVSLIDMTSLTEQYFERIGQAATTDLFLVLAPGEFPNYPDGTTDNTHFQESGARKLGQLVAYDAYRQRLPLASYLKAVPTAP